MAAIRGRVASHVRTDEEPHPSDSRRTPCLGVRSKLEPVPDWDLILSWIPYEDVYAELAATKSCPKAVYFLALLYFIVGDAVRTEFRNRSKDDIEALLAKLESRCPKHVIRQWAQRSRELLAHPDRFRHADWCAGGLAQECTESRLQPESNDNTRS